MKNKTLVSDRHNPFFSVVMPCFNSEKYISEAIESVINQSFQDWELIIVDDASIDSTYEIIRKYEKSDSRIKSHSLTKNSGFALIPRSTAIEIASGSYISNLDSDDTIEKDYLFKIYNRIKTTSAECILSAKSDCGFDLLSIISGKECLKNTLNGWKITAGFTVTKKLYLNTFHSLKDIKFSVFTDELLTRLIILNASKIAFTDSYYFYRQNINSISRKFSINQLNRIDTSLYLKNVVYDNFPVDSEERELINLQILNETINLARYFMKNYKKLGKNTSKVYTILNNTWKNIDFQCIKKSCIPPLKFILNHSNPFIICILIKCYGFFKRR